MLSFLGTEKEKKSKGLLQKLHVGFTLQKGPIISNQLIVTDIVTIPSYLSVLSMLAFYQLNRLVSPASIKPQSFLANIFFHQPTLSRVPFVFPLCKSYSSFIREDSIVAFFRRGFPVA